MSYAERNTWAQLVASFLGVIVYVILVAPQLWQRPIGDVEWVWPMIWTIAGAIVLGITLSIVWGLVAGARDPSETHSADQRDREIEWFGDRIGTGFMVIGSLAALILVMLEAEAFWIGNAIFFGFFLAASVGGVARLIAYRKGFQ